MDTNNGGAKARSTGSPAEDEARAENAQRNAEDATDAAVATKRLAEIDANPERLVRGAALDKMLRDPRLPPANTVLQRALKDGKNIEVIVGEGDFTYGGKTFKSLSAIAKLVTGTPWNGYLFFGLTTRKAAA